MHADHPRSHHDRRRGHRRAETNADTNEVIQPSSQTWERIPLGDDAELLIRSHKAQKMGTRLYRTLHKLRHMIESEESDNEGNRS